jgi:hypothetical protein
MHKISDESLGYLIRRMIRADMTDYLDIFLNKLCKNVTYDDKCDVSEDLIENIIEAESADHINTLLDKLREDENCEGIINHYERFIRKNTVTCKVCDEIITTDHYYDNDVDMRFDCGSGTDVDFTCCCDALMERFHRPETTVWFCSSSCYGVHKKEFIDSKNNKYIILLLSPSHDDWETFLSKQQ